MGFGKRVESMLDLPGGSLSGEAFLEICGTAQVIVSGECEIMQYEEDVICFRSRGRTVRLRGDHLTIETLTTSSMVVVGALLSVEFL